MQLSELNTIYLRPAPRLPKLIALAMVYWQAWKNGVPLPQIFMLPESEQPTGPGIYNLDCHGNGYRQRNLAGEAEVVLDDFTEIEVSPALDCLAELVMDHNERSTTTEKGNRSTRNLLNRYPGSLGFMTGSAWEVVHTISARKWKEIIYGQTQEEVTPGPLTEDDFLRLCTHVIFIYVQAHNTSPKQRNWKDADASLHALLDTDFQGKRIGQGLGQPLTVATYIRDLWELGFNLEEIHSLTAPWMSIWLRLEQCLEEAPKLTPTYQFHIGTTNRYNGMVFDFRTANGKPVRGSDNPLVHQAWLSDGEDGLPRANCVIVRRASGHVAIFCRGVDERTIKDLGYFLMGEENGSWLYEGGWVIFNGSKSRSDHPSTRLPLTGNKSITSACACQLRLVLRRPIPARKFSRASA